MDIKEVLKVNGFLRINIQEEYAGKIIAGCLKDLFKMRRFKYKFVNLRERIIKIQRIYRKFSRKNK